MSTRLATPEQVLAAYTGCKSFEELAEEVADARIELAELRADKARLDWLEETMRHELGACTPERHIGCAVHMGTPIREAIDAARAPSEPATLPLPLTETAKA